MSRQSLYRGALVVLAALTLSWVAVSCASAPPKTEPVVPKVEVKPEPAPAPVVAPPPAPEPAPAEPVPAPVPEPTPEPAPVAPVVEAPPAPVPVSDEEFQTAQAAIAEAEAAEAETYSPGLLNEARAALNDARAKGASAPDDARVSLALAVTKAHEARDASLVARTKVLSDRLAEAETLWKALHPDQWDPEGSVPVQTQVDAAKAALASDYATGKPAVEAAIVALNDAKTKLANRLTAVQTLRSDAQKALDEAEAVDAFVWVPDLVQEANDAFFQGTGAWKKYRLDAAEEAWSTALFDAKSAGAKARAELARKQTEQLMLDTMKKLEDASGKTVVDPQDNIIAPQQWDGRKELEKIQKKPLSLVIPTDGSVAVLGEKQRINYLDEAKDQWTQGVKALDAGDLTLANESFFQAQKLIDTYLSLAVDKVYTVRLNPDRRDSLWRISEYGDIYATPWDWPKIWRRNQKLIQNPDLIYPGWQLIIPPQ